MSNFKNKSQTMTRRLSVIAVHTALAMVAGTAHAEDWKDMFSFSGFGTVAATHSNSANGDYVTSYSETAGPGASNSWAFGVDSRLGLQVNAKFTDQLTGVVQVVVQDQTNNTFSPRFEWANLGYAITPDLEVRIGRTALPGFLVSDTRMVGYSNPWVRPPTETYDLFSITNSDGLDVRYKLHFGSVNNTIQAFDGRTSIDVYVGNGTVLPGLVAKQLKGLTDTVDYGSLTARVGITRANLTLNEGPFVVDSKAQLLNFGISYDPGSWFIQSEFSKGKLPNISSNETAFYITAGYRIKDFTPYVSYSQAKPQSGTGPTGDDAKTPALGLRWDFMKNTDLKVQWDRVSLGSDSTGYFTNLKPGMAGSTSNIVTVAVDFVF